MKKYNLSQIMKNAWNMVKTAGTTISAALKKAWAIAKCNVKKEFTGVALVGEGMSIKMFKKWSNYGKNRIYINRQDGKKSYGYIDLDNGNQVVTTKDGNHSTNLEIVEIFMAQYNF